LALAILAAEKTLSGINISIAIAIPTTVLGAPGALIPALIAGFRVEEGYIDASSHKNISETK
jgi:hypothetical protein